MGDNDEGEKKAPAPLSDLEASSGPQEKGAGDDLKVLLAQLRMRVQGLESHEIEAEIDAFMEKLIDRQAKVVPENLRAEHRALLRNMLEEDPTLRALRADLRRGIDKPG